MPRACAWMVVADRFRWRNVRRSRTMRYRLCRKSTALQMQEAHSVTYTSFETLLKSEPNGGIGTGSWALTVTDPQISKLQVPETGRCTG